MDFGKGIRHRAVYLSFFFLKRHHGLGRISGSCGVFVASLDLGGFDFSLHWRTDFYNIYPKHDEI